MTISKNIKEENEILYTKFIVDAMLGSIARKLRIFGFDVLYDSNNLDKNILTVAENDNRIIITSDKELHKRAIQKKIKSILSLEKEEVEKMVIIFKTLKILPHLNPNISRCSSCNGNIKKINKLKFQIKIPSRVFEKHDNFFQCTICGKIYWLGKHWTKLEKFYTQIMQKLLQI